MSMVGVKELKDHLSGYIKKVKSGETLIVTERGRPVAYMTRIGQEDIMDEVLPLIKEGVVEWKGGKPKGNPKAPAIKGKPTSEIVLEDRR